MDATPSKLKQDKDSGKDPSKDDRHREHLTHKNIGTEPLTWQIIL